VPKKIHLFPLLPVLPVLPEIGPDRVNNPFPAAVAERDFPSLNPAAPFDCNPPENTPGPFVFFNNHFPPPHQAETAIAKITQWAPGFPDPMN